MQEERQPLSPVSPPSRSLVSPSPDYQHRVAKLRAMLTAPVAPGGALSRLLFIGQTCERVRELDFFELSRTLCAEAVDWSKDASCGEWDSKWDVLEMLDLISHKTAPELRRAIEECIDDGGSHLRAILDLDVADMAAAFFLELLEAAARDAASAGSSGSGRRGAVGAGMARAQAAQHAANALGEANSTGSANASVLAPLYAGPDYEAKLAKAKEQHAREVGASVKHLAAKFR